jgi:HK97 family phage portal protein
MKILGLTITRTKAAQQTLMPLSSRGGWWNIVREPFMGAWQTNQEIRLDNVLTYSAVFSCVTLIAADVAKLCLRLVEQDADGIWTETSSPAFSPVLRKPNRYQTRVKFIEQWMVSKLIHGNTYVLKQRDQRGVVVAMYVLDPTRVIPLVAQDGGVYYQLRRDDLSGLPIESVTVPASEIIHDTMVALFHPLVGVSPIYACGVAALQGLSIQSNSQKFFSNGSNPGGVLTAPGAISDETAQRLKGYWDANYTGDNVGKVAVLGDGLTYEGMAVNAVDSQLIDQLKWTGETVCTAFHVPPYMIGIGPPPPYANIEPLLQQYYAQCIQTQLTSIELVLDDGLGLTQKIDGTQYGTEFDIDDLIWMDTATRVNSAKTAISGGLSPDETRAKYFGVGKIPGGDQVYMQQQMWPLKQLAERDIPVPTNTPGQGSAPVNADPQQMDMAATASFASALHRKALAEGLYAA